MVLPYLRKTSRKSYDLQKRVVTTPAYSFARIYPAMTRNSMKAQCTIAVRWGNAKAHFLPRRRCQFLNDHSALTGGLWAPFFCLLNISLWLTGAPAQSPSPSPNATHDTDEGPAHPLTVQLPLIVGMPSKTLRLPEYGLSGQLLSFLKAATVKRLDEDHLQMDSMVIDLYKPDGRPDFSIDLPTSSFNTKTRIIASVDPVKITSPEFVLSGERLKFNTYTREGQLLGHVTMKIFNMKGGPAVGDSSH